MRDYTPSPSHNLSHFLRNPHTPRGMTYFTDIPRTFITGQGLFCLNWKHYTGRGVSYFTCLYTWSGPDGWNVGHVIEKWHNLCLSINCKGHSQNTGIKKQNMLAWGHPKGPSANPLLSSWTNPVLYGWPIVSHLALTCGYPWLVQLSSLFTSTRGVVEWENGTSSRDHMFKRGNLNIQPFCDVTFSCRCHI